MDRINMETAKRIRAAMAVAALILGLSGSQTHSAAPPAASGSDEPKGIAKPIPGPALLLKVVDQANGSPLTDAPVWVRATGRHVRTWEGKTDDQGRYRVVPPDESTRTLTITAASAGYAPGGLRAGVGVVEYTLELQPAEEIGGVVRDERGRPVQGARVFATIYPFTKLWPEIYASPNSPQAIATTDAGGRWRLDALPVDAGPGARPVRVLVTHPDYLASEATITTEVARARSSTQTIRPGLALIGTVLSPFGRPVRDADVIVAVPPWDGTTMRLTTDKDGRFRTGRCLDPRWSTVAMTVQVTGLAWDFRAVPLSPELWPQVVRLTRRRPLEGRVVDDHGQPLSGAVVSCSRRFFKELIDWEAETDATGRFVWYDAPTEGVLLLQASRLDFQPVNVSIVRPGTDEKTITLKPE